MRCCNQLTKVTSAENQDVLDYIAGWSDLGVAVVPGELEQLEQIQRSLNSVVAEHLSDTIPTLIPAFRSTHGHHTVCSTIRRYGAVHWSGQRSQRGRGVSAVTLELGR